MAFTKAVVDDLKTTAFICRAAKAADSCIIGRMLLFFGRSGTASCFILKHDTPLTTEIYNDRSVKVNETVKVDAAPGGTLWPTNGALIKQKLRKTSKFDDSERNAR